LTQEQIEKTAGLNSALSLQLWHRFEFARHQPFMRWIIALGIPLPQSAAKALSAHSWRELQDKDAGSWNQLPGIGAEKARKLVEFLHDPQVTRLATWLGEQGVNGF